VGQNKKLLWSFISSIAFSIIGLILIFDGILHGKEMAIYYSRLSRGIQLGYIR
jgi:hypothetical protein